jgi:spore coat protein U-like protein
MIGLVKLGAALLLLACGGTAFAQSCTVSPQAVAFGGYDALSSAPTDGVGTIRVGCDAAANFTVGLSAGNGGGQGSRAMQGGQRALQYDLYADPSRSSPWGDGSGLGGPVSAGGTDTDLTVYGRIPARQNVPAGTYSDVIVVTVSF